MSGSNYRPVICIVAAICFAVHMVLGCCVHHGHAGQQESTAPADGCCSGHGHASHEYGHGHASHEPPVDPSDGNHSDDEDHHGHSPSDCQGDHCFVVVSKLTEVTPDVTSDTGCWSKSPLCGDPPALVSAGDDSSLGFTRAIALPVRAHLFCNVLLL